MKKEKYLSDIVKIRFGINAKAILSSEIPYLQGKDFTNNGKLREKNIFSVNSNNVQRRDFLRKGDILFSGKGNRNYAVVWNDQIQNAVASATFFVMSIENGEILPNYLAWYLNSSKAQTYFREHVRATTIFTISKQVLDNLTVIVPSIEIQEKIVKIAQHYLYEKDLAWRIAEKREKLVSTLLTKLVK